MAIKNVKRSFMDKFYNRDEAPKEIFNWRLFVCVLVFGILGAARGLDEGSIAGSLGSDRFVERFGLDDPTKSDTYLANLKSNISAMVQLGSIGGSLLSIYFVDRFGRVRTLQGVCLFWIVAVIIQLTAKEVGQLYAGRLLEGLAIGQTVVIGPTYMSEVAPKSIRGLCGCTFAGSVYLAIMIEYFAYYGCTVNLSADSDNQWIIPTAIKIILSGLIFIGTFFTLESPRWLIKKNRLEKGIKNLSKLRSLPDDHPYVLAEISDIEEQIATFEKERGDSTLWDLFKGLFSKTMIYRLYIGIGIQLLGQWSGSNAITIYSSELFSLVGYSGDKNMLMVGFLGLIKFGGAYLTAFFLIDFLGRKKCLYTGITIQAVSIFYFALYVHFVPNADDENYVMSSTEKAASKGALAFLYLSGFGWTMGFNACQYLTSEIFPLKYRNIAMSCIMTFHFVNQYANTKAVPSMMIAMKHSGTFFFFFAILVISLFWSWFTIPEVSGRSIEGMDELFKLPWHVIGRKGVDLCPDNSGVNRVHFDESGRVNRDVMDYKRDNEEFIENATQASSAGDILTNKDTINTTIDGSDQDGNYDLSDEASIDSEARRSNIEKPGNLV